MFAQDMVSILNQGHGFYSVTMSFIASRDRGRRFSRPFTESPHGMRSATGVPKPHAMSVRGDGKKRQSFASIKNGPQLHIERRVDVEIERAPDHEKP